ncbi:MAG: NapC/NirT family cytochrome c [Woeseiaceae bacterium]
MFRNFISSITRNGLSLFGTGLAIASLVLIVSLFVIEGMGYDGGPYLGILTFLILPMIFVVGLLLIPLGSFLYRRSLRKVPGGESVPLLPIFDLNKPKTRNWLLVLTGVTMVNIVIVAGATYKGVEVMESVEFCGMACHSVMEPEHTAYQRSSHSRVSCAECHIGPGADWFVKSKLDGAWQLVAVAFDLYPRPIPTPLHDLRPARETCEQCHWPTRFVGDKLSVRKHYEEDEANTELTTVLLLKVGGTAGGGASGIHWHVDRGVQIRYRSDESRENVYEVEYTNADGEVKLFADRKAPEDGGTWREMDCVDCHNRPSHNYQAPGAEIDVAIRDGLIDRSLPFVRKEGLRIIDAEYASHEEAREVITAELGEYYRENYPEIATERAEDIAEAATALGDIYSVNVFPQMKVWWNTYPEHIGHETSDGCYRCHGKRLRTKEREHISRDCDVCHTVLAEREEDPEILTQLNP